MTAPAQPNGNPRYVVNEHGPRDFSVYDTVSHLSYDPRFTRRAAQGDADRRNAELANPAKGSCACGQPLTLGTVHRTDGPCYVDEQTS